MHILVIANPVAGRGQGRRVAQAVAAFARTRGGTADVQYTAPAAVDGDRTATALAKRLGAGIDRLVVVGGDGTLREAIAGLRGGGHRPTIVAVPLGNANIVARELGIPLKPEAAMALVDSPRAQPVDVGIANDELFLGVLGIGFDAAIVERVSRARATPFGAKLYRFSAGAGLVYGAAGIAAAAAHYPARYQLRIADHVEDVATVWFVNVRCYAKGWSLAPDANCSDGELNVRAEKNVSLRTLPRMLVGMVRRKAPTHPSTLTARGTTFEVTSNAPFCWQLDGDAMPATTRLDVGILPACVDIAVPDAPLRSQ